VALTVARSEALTRNRIALYFAQHNLAGCYFYGKLENLDIQVLVSYILKKHGIPAVAADFIDANAGIRILELEAALQKMVVRELKNKEVQPGFYYEADLFIKGKCQEVTH
jgi:hypothetical protein